MSLETGTFKPQGRNKTDQAVCYRATSEGLFIHAIIAYDGQY